VSRPDYNADLDYLIAVSSYLAFSERWSGTPSELSTYLALDRDKIKYVFDVYRSIFRKSLRPSGADNDYVYCLHLRFAQRRDLDAPPDQDERVPPLDVEKMSVVVDFILKAAEMGQTRRTSTVTNTVAVIAAIISAITAILVGVLGQ
jgi:hypothetical protein